MRYICAFFLFLLPLSLPATSVPRISFEAVVAQSDLIVTGQVVRSWAAWDADHRFIWTNTEIAVHERWKGSPGATVTVSEPGGEVAGIGQSVSGAVRYGMGEQVVLFLYQTPMGTLRTVGWGQGKLHLDAQQRAHLTQSDADMVATPAGTQAGTPLRAIEAENLISLRARVARVVASGAKQ